MRDTASAEVSRRALLGGFAVGVTAWATPSVLQSVPAAAAVGSPPPGGGAPPAAPPTSSFVDLEGDLGMGPAPGAQGGEPPQVLGEAMGAPAARASGAAPGPRPPPGSVTDRLPATGASLDELARIGALALAGGAGLVAWRRVSATGAEAGGAGRVGNAPASRPPAASGAGCPERRTAGAPRLVRARGALWRRAGAGRVVVLPPSGPPLLLAGPGVLLWDLLAQPVGLEEAAGLVAEAYGVEPERAAQDIGPTLDRLREHGLVEPPPGAA